ncbi:uncharacterized protein Bfra_009629 [Botrytis fragariae]|uniref:Uncharacterized protein n=1 Tax=Botrytis fragariae TaxID=1964551 RepID=A0A8H6AMS7_9HELO|nr:uncharacterized protein Bfra_009629 [Botrytis fragariae]KAF5870246.1 hypothetical protein Bfra_009629 [Botrytis fragariae]
MHTSEKLVDGADARYSTAAALVERGAKVSGRHPYSLQQRTWDNYVILLTRSAPHEKPKSSCNRRRLGLLSMFI